MPGEGETAAVAGRADILKAGQLVVVVLPVGAAALLDSASIFARTCWAAARVGFRLVCRVRRLALQRRGSLMVGDHSTNSLLLRLLDGEEALRRLGDELAEVGVREKRLRTDLEEEGRRTRPSPSTGSQDRKHQLEEASRLLAERRSQLVHRRADLITELDGCRARLVVLE